jgi:chromosome segregation ATPase
VPNPSLGVRCWCAVAVGALAACSVHDEPILTTADEPERARESPREAPAIADGSLAALTAEVRHLRLAVEELARSQTETQALSVYLSAQQSRLQQADQQLAIARRELDSATAARDSIEEQLTDLSAEQPRATSAERRAQLEEAINGLKFEQARVDRDLQQARSRENELSRELQSEETRWNDLIARLEALTR